ncbi:MAG TPA: hypothetical protein VMW66_00440 [Elusimicrobiales bacterium]|nr:hypothetical protein [Elusimicrobiales bacterium]
MSKDTWQPFVQPVVDLWEKFISIVPSILISLVFLLIGLMLSRIVTTVLTKALKKIKFDDITSKLGINEILARVGFGKSPTYVISFIAYWLIMLMFIILAFKALNLDIMTTLLERFMYFVPKLIISIIILFAGMLFANFVHDVVRNSADVNNLKGGKILAKIIQGIIILFAALLALEQLGIEMSLINQSVMIVLSSLGLAFAIALGLGAKDIVAKFLQDSMKNED